MNKYILIGIPLFCGAIIGTTVTMSIHKTHAETIEVPINPNQPSNTTVSNNTSNPSTSQTVGVQPNPDKPSDVSVSTPTTVPTASPTIEPQPQNTPQTSPCTK